MSNFVLVPGAWLGAWSWQRVTPLLRQRKHEVFPVTLTGMGERVHLARPEFGLEVAVQDVVNMIRYEGLHDVVLVGHSFAGKVIAGVFDKIPERIDTLLFLDATRPAKTREPQGGFDSWPPKDREEIMDDCRRRGEGWKWLLSDVILENIGHDVVGKDKEWMLSKITPTPIKLIGDSIVLSSNYDKAKRAFIFCTGGGDDIEEIRKEKIDGEYKIIESGHYPMITKPNELAQDMMELTR
jgi:pimeloyl-ACP methyl ester carboxylesterase